MSKSSAAKLLAAFALVGLAPRAAAADPCEPHKARYRSAHPLTITGALALHAREATPSMADMRCLESTWNPRDGSVAASATRTLLIVIAQHRGIAIAAAGERQELYREWLADVARYGIHDVNGEGRLLRRSITQLLTAAPKGPAEEAGRKVLLDGLSAVQVFRLD